MAVPGGVLGPDRARIRRGHRHPNSEEILYVLRGRATQGVGDEERELRPGDVALVRRDEVHWTRSAGDEPLVLLVLFSHPKPETVDL